MDDNIETKVIEIVSEQMGVDKSEITLRQLMTHRSGLVREPRRCRITGHA
jgi:CubicO group peptidase (beta-lactamase class C family)